MQSVVKVVIMIGTHNSTVIPNIFQDDETDNKSLFR